MVKKKSKNNRKSLCIIIAVVAFVSVFGIYLIAGIVPPTKVDYSGVETEYDADDYRTAVSEYTEIKLSDSDIAIKKAGAYRISGALSDGTIYIAADGVVHLIMDGASISCSSGPAVYISAADKVIITSADGSSNTIKATVSGGLESAIYSDTDVTFNGKGRLNISSENGIAVNCNTNVRFVDGEYWIEAKENAVKAIQNISMCGGTVNAVTSSDAIKTTASGKSNGKWYGVVDINGGTLNISSEGDGVNSASVIHIGSGEVNVFCGGGSSEVAESMQMPDMMGGMKQDEKGEVNAKGLKADTGIYLDGGIVHIDCVDDAIHSDGDVTVDGCELHILSDNDGIQGAKRVNIKSGNVSIERSLEGICGRYIIFDGGTVDITASDDGVNATNNSNPIAALGFEFEILGTGGKLIVNDGTVNIVASADGLDSNGSIKQNGGYVTVVSKSNGVEVPIDYTGKYEMTGGTLTAFGGGGHMMQGISEQGSTVCSVTVGASVQAGSTITVQESDGNELFSITSEYDSASVIIASDKLIAGNEIRVLVNDVEIGSAVLTESSATIGTVSGGTMGGRPNDMQGGQIPDGQTPPDMQGGMQNGQKPNGMLGGQMEGGMHGMRGPFGFATPIIVILLAGIGTTIFVFIKKKKKKKEYDETEDENDLS